MMKPGLLLLTHRIPFPPNKGDKIRSYHLFRFLAKHYQVHLGTFIDDEADWQHVAFLQEYSSSYKAFGIQPKLAQLKSLQGFVRNEPLSISYYRHSKMRHWVRQIMNTRGIMRVMVFSSSMAQFVESYMDRVTTVVDFVDVDSDKWRQYAQSKNWPMSAIYRREARLLSAYEKSIAAKSSASVFVSQAEARLFQQNSPTVSHKVHFINNGVDAHYFTPQGYYENPYGPNKKIIVFTGAMDYWANADAVIWFSHQVMPAIIARIPNASFYIVGAKPSRAVKQLHNGDSIHVTGKVADVRPFLNFAHVVVAPLRIARGIQNKILEALAMGKAVVSTSAAMEGITLNENEFNRVRDQAAEFADACCNYLQRQDIFRFSAARQFVLEHYLWEKNLEQYLSLLERSTTTTVSSR